MARLTSRWYRDERDLARMLRLVTASDLAGAPDMGHLHRGDVVWGLFQNRTIDPTRRVRLFEDGRGALRGFVWLDPPRAFSIQVNVAMGLYPADIQQIARWAESHLGPGEPLTVEVPWLAMDIRIALMGLGYRDTGEARFQLNTRPIGDDLPEPALLSGAAVRPVRLDDPAEVAARVALHREVWAPSKFTAGGYARLRTMPVYRPELDLVAVTPAGELAAYCIVWWDGETKTGLFEPVGAATRHRRQGYAKALLFDALRRLRELGAERANVVSGTDTGSEPARRLYAAAGFGLAGPFERWQRDPSHAEP